MPAVVHTGLDCRRRLLSNLAAVAGIDEMGLDAHTSAKCQQKARLSITFVLLAAEACRSLRT